MTARGIYMLRVPRPALRLAVATIAVLALVLGPAALPGASSVRAGDPVVRAVIFYSPACGHCHKVMTEDLPPLLEQHGDALQIAAIDVTPDDGQALYLAAVERFGLQDRLGVPTLIVGDEVMIGSAEIPERFPGLVDEYLAGGGVDWPDVPGLAAALATPAPATADPSAAAPAATDPVASPDPANPATADPTASPAAVLPVGPVGGAGSSDDDLAARLARDPVANTLAIVILAAMLVAVAWAVATALRVREGIVARPPSPWLAAVALVGVVAAAYLAYVETAAVTAVCGPVGDCNTVQQSSFARLFGVLPIGVLGLAGYVAILGAWLMARRPGSMAARPARVALLAMTFGGTLFSIYLTFLEPFVIGAVCAWCLTSAVVMTLLLVVAIRSMAEPPVVPIVPPPAAPTPA